jgi:hypothetical protein
MWQTTHIGGITTVKQEIYVKFAGLNATARKVNFTPQISPILALFSRHRILPIWHIRSFNAQP